MRCQQVHRYVDAYMDGELEATPAVELEQHLDGCADCSNALATARMMKRAVREQVAAERAPEAFRQRILHRLLHDL